MGGKRKTHHVLVPVIRRILFVPFISKVPEHILNLVVLLHGRRDLGVSHGIGVVELLKVLEVVDVVGDLDASARDADLVAGEVRVLLLGLRAWQPKALELLMRLTSWSASVMSNSFVNWIVPVDEVERGRLIGAVCTKEGEALTCLQHEEVHQGEKFCAIDPHQLVDPRTEHHTCRPDSHFTLIFSGVPVMSTLGVREKPGSAS